MPDQEYLLSEELQFDLMMRTRLPEDAEISGEVWTYDSSEFITLLIDCNYRDNERYVLTMLIKKLNQIFDVPEENFEFLTIRETILKLIRIMFGLVNIDVTEQEFVKFVLEKTEPLGFCVTMMAGINQKNHD